MTLLLEVAGGVALLLFAPLTVWAERRVKAWTQMRRGPSWVQPYRDLRRLLHKDPLVPQTAGRFYRAAPWMALGCVLAALLLLPVYGPSTTLGGPVSLLVLALLFTLQRAIVATQAYDTGTSFGGIGSSRELFLGGLAEPVFLLVAAAAYLETGSAGIPSAPLPLGDPASWLIVGAVAFAWLAESARIPFDNPATHLELTMVHEALILESNGAALAVYEFGAVVKQAALAGLVLTFTVPFPESGLARVGLFIVGIVALSGLLALFESGIAKVRLFRASHLLVMAALFAFLGGVVTYFAAEIA